MVRRSIAVVLLTALVAVVIPLGAGTALAADDPSPPASPVKLVFVHHSSGENWLRDVAPGDENAGGLGLALRDNNYFVSDTDYTWGPADADMGYQNIGDHTNIGSWHNWFHGAHSATYLTALYSESGQQHPYSRLATDPGGENKVIMFKSCFPNSALGGNPADPPTPIGSNPLASDPESTDPSVLTVGNAKGIYVDLLQYFQTRLDKLFIVITAPPLTDDTYAANARAFNNWLANDWLTGYGHSNVFVFDYYNVLTSNVSSPANNDLGAVGGNHHRWYGGAVQHQVSYAGNVEAYPSGDDHPGTYGNQKATGEFPQLLNVAYNRFISEPVYTPHISDIGGVAGGYPGTTVQMTGTHFGGSDTVPPTAEGTVRFGNVQATVTSWADAQITCTVPSGALPQGDITVTASWGPTSNSVPFFVCPYITSVSPTWGNAGVTYITMTGYAFGTTRGSNSVWFDGSKATTYTAWSNNSIRVQIGAGAQGQSHVKVMSSGCYSNAKAFDVRPLVNGISPASGAAGATITIPGSSFCNSQGTGCVYFGSKAVTSVVSWKQTQIKVRVPSGISGTVQLKVYTNGGMSNYKNFTKA